MQSLINSAIALLKDYIDTQYKGNISEASRSIGIHEQTVYKWIKGERIPSFSKIEPFLKHIGAKLLVPSQLSSKSEEFSLSENSLTQPLSQTMAHKTNYLSIPLIEQHNAALFFQDSSYKHSSFLLNIESQNLSGRTNLIAVRLAQTSTCMLPLLCPSDIVIVDRNDKNIKNSNSLFLVSDPQGHIFIRRISILEKKHSEKSIDTTIIFTSDNTAQSPPEVYSLKEDYLGDWQRIIIGRLVLAYTDLLEK